MRVKGGVVVVPVVHTDRVEIALFFEDEEQRRPPLNDAAKEEYFHAGEEEEEDETRTRMGLGRHDALRLFLGRRWSLGL